MKLNGGMNTFKWYLTAPHASANWKYYITKKDWDPNKPLTRSALELEPFCVYDFEGKKPNTVAEHECEVPTDRSGYHIILGVWEIADTANAFYQVIDVDLTNDGSGDHGSGDESKPTVPGNLSADSITSTSVSLKWASSTSPSGIKEYQIYQDHVLIGSTTNQSYRCSNLKPDTTYKFAVRAVDKKGKLSGLSNIVTVKTLPNSGNGGDAKYPAWDAKTVYLEGKRVQYNGSEYEARWWTLNEEPGRAEVWKKLK